MSSDRAIPASDRFVIPGYVAVAAGIALVVHALMFFYDAASAFQPFFQGDRSYNRWEEMLAFHAAEPSRYLAVLAASSVCPGEYLFVYPAYLIAGKAGIVAFQIVLTLLSVACVARIAAMIFPWKRAPLILGLVYAVLPQNLVFPHQFVTEAIATPFCVFFLYFYLVFLKTSRWGPLLAAGLFTGLAIFVRPSLAFILPAMLVCVVLYPKGPRLRSLVQASVFCAVALLPMAVWVPAFTAVTGKVGYTGGVANLSWNLRSKVFLVHTDEGLPKPPEVARYARYEDLYDDTGGIGMARFLAIAAEHPAAFAKSSLVDVLIVTAKANASKFVVDYLGIARTKNIKEWRDVLATRGIPGLLTWGFGNVDLMFDFIIEIALSIVTALAVAAVSIFYVLALVRPRHVAERIGGDAFQLIMPIGALFFATLVSSQLVDHAQARLRNPAELGILILCGLILLYRQQRRQATI